MANKEKLAMTQDHTKLAVYNNAVWCATVCGAHGWPGEFHAEIWINGCASLPYYPNAVTLTAQHAATQLERLRQLDGAGLAEGWAVKDSFALLDLTPLGYQPLFEATWIYRAATHSQISDPLPNVRWRKVLNVVELEAWENAWRGAPVDESAEQPSRLFLPALLADPEVAFLAAYEQERLVAGAIANRTGAVVGLSNLFVPTENSPRWWASCVAAVSALFPDLPLVGYERGDDLNFAQSAGFSALAPLRIWLKARAEL